MRPDQAVHVEDCPIWIKLAHSFNRAWRVGSDWLAYRTRVSHAGEIRQAHESNSCKCATQAGTRIARAGERRPITGDTCLRRKDQRRPKDCWQSAGAYRGGTKCSLPSVYPAGLQPSVALAPYAAVKALLYTLENLYASGRAVESRVKVTRKNRAKAMSTRPGLILSRPENVILSPGLLAVQAADQMRLRGIPETILRGLAGTRSPNKKQSC